MRSFKVPELESGMLTPEYLEALDAVVISTDHTAFDYQLISDHATLVIDTRNSMAETRPSLARIIKA